MYKMKNELEFYTRPFMIPYIGRVHDAKGNFVFQIETLYTKGKYAEGEEKLKEEILLSLNAIDHEPIERFNLTVQNGIEIYDKDRFLILIRGWGNLTGIGAYNFSDEKARNIQDKFVLWLIEKLTKKKEDDNITIT